MNTLIAEIGSSKSDWFFVGSDGVVDKKTGIGFNPVLSSIPPDDFVPIEILDRLTEVEELFYYGAGALDHTRGIIEKIFDPIYSGQLHIESDMLAASRACCYSAEGYVGILGTGTNTCYYDGKNNHPLLPSLGYVLGDFGSGSYIGRKILQDFFYLRMPKEVHEQFDEEYCLTADKVIAELYGHDFPSQYLGNYARFLSEINHEWKDTLLQNVFEEFADVYYAPHRINNKMKFNFVGSIAYVYKEILEKVMSEKGLEIGVVLRAPADNLIDYHLSMK